MTDSVRRDPYSSFNFRVVVDGVSIGEFSEVSGLTAEGDAVDLKAANLQPTVRKLVGLHKYASSVATCGISHCGIGARAKVIAARSQSR